MTTPETRREYAAIFITLLGLLVVVGCLFAKWDTLGPVGWAAVTGVVFAGLGPLLFYRKVSTSEVELEDRGRALSQQQTQLEVDRDELEAFQKQVRRELDEEAAGLEQRANDLTNRLVNIEQWMEYPQSIVPESDAAAQAALTAKDQQVIQMLEAESERFFEYIRANRYTDDGDFNAKLLRDDVLNLAESIAHVYRPDVENPLLETSIEQILRATSRATFHLLIALDQLPLNVKEYNIASVYSYVRNAVVAYGVYKAAAPYLSFLSRGFHVGRMATSANPLIAGAWWLAGELGKRGGKAAVEKLVHQQAIGLLHEFIRIIGYAVAEIYGEDFRHRDPNWVYGVELASLCSHFPLSRDSLGHALREVSTLELRNEYDRVYLFRCLADHKSPDMKLSRPANLPTDQQQTVATRLETYLGQHIHGKTDDALEKWHSDVTERFDVHVTRGTTAEPLSQRDRLKLAAETVAAFLTHVKGLSVEEAASRISAVALLNPLNTDESTELIESIVAEPLREFVAPSLEPDDSLTDDLIRELARQQAACGEFDPNADHLLIEFGGYFRKDSSALREMLDEQYEAVICSELSAFSRRRVTGELARAILEVRRPDELPQAIYTKVTAKLGPRKIDDSVVLAVMPSRLLAIKSGSHPETLWEARPDAVAGFTRDSGILIDSCVVTGGQTTSDESTLATFTIDGTIGIPFESHFEPIVENVSVEG